MSRQDDQEDGVNRDEQELADYVQRLFASQGAPQAGDELRSMRLATRTAAAVSRLQDDPLLSSTLRAFDGEGLALPEDPVLAARLVSAAVLASPPPPARKRRARSWLGMPMAASVFLVSSGVLAATALVAQVVVPAFVASEVVPHARKASKQKRSPAPVVAAPVESPAEVVQPAESPAEAHVAPTPKPRAHLQVVPASQLFAEANRERRSGHTRNAVALYKRLIDRHDGAAEAGLARLSLAEIDAAAGRRSQALVQLNAFLRSSSSPALVQEALQRKARLLAAAHRTSEARATWKELRTRFPQSVYRAEAERFLASPASQ